MKKGRLGTRIEVLARPADAGRLEQVLLTATTTIGVRRQVLERRVLPRRLRAVMVLGHRVAVKETTLPNGETRAKPEFDDVLRVAQATGRPAGDIFALTAEAAQARRYEPDAVPAGYLGRRAGAGAPRPARRPGRPFAPFARSSARPFTRSRASFAIRPRSPTRPLMITRTCQESGMPASGLSRFRTAFILLCAGTSVVAAPVLSAQKKGDKNAPAACQIDNDNGAESMSGRLFLSRVTDPKTPAPDKAKELRQAVGTLGGKYDRNKEAGRDYLLGEALVLFTRGAGHGADRPAQLVRIQGRPIDHGRRAGVGGHAADAHRDLASGVRGPDQCRAPTGVCPAGERLDRRAQRGRQPTRRAPPRSAP